jgi:hypothetical protein
MVVATCAPKPLGVLLWSRTSKLNIKTEGIGTLHPKLISTVHGFCRSIINPTKKDNTTGQQYIYHNYKYPEDKTNKTNRNHQYPSKKIQTPQKSVKQTPSQ